MLGPVSVLFLASWFLHEPITVRGRWPGPRWCWQGYSGMMQGGAAKALPAALAVARRRAEIRFSCLSRNIPMRKERPAWPAISSRQSVSSSMAVPKS